MNAAAAAEEASAGPTYELTQSAAQTIVAETFAITEEIFNDIRGHTFELPPLSNPETPTPNRKFAKLRITSF